jgi:putative addiction module killer protein
MEPKRREIRYYQMKTGKTPYLEFLRSLSEAKERMAVDARVYRAASGNFGDHSPVGGGLFEMRIHLGPGFRVYYGLDGDTVVVITSGGEKGTQRKDIQNAKAFWADYLNRGK